MVPFFNSEQITLLNEKHTLSNEISIRVQYKNALNNLGRVYFTMTLLKFA